MQETRRELPKSPLPAEAHRMCISSSATMCDNACNLVNKGSSLEPGCPGFLMEGQSLI